MTRYLKTGALDREECEREPIERIGALQAPFALAVFCPQDGRIRAISANLPELSGLSAGTLDGLPVGELFAALPDVVAGATASETVTAPARLANGTDCVARIVQLGRDRAVVIDPSPAQASSPGAFSDILGFNRLLEAALAEEEPDIVALGDRMARAFRAISGFDRVMVYRFDTDWNGTIIAEAAAEGIEARFIGLTFPSSDIPQPARALFLKNRVRPLVDATAEPVALRVFGGAGPDSLDIGVLRERAVSPVHLAYLANMGVRATLTIALVVNGRLWGLLTSHHYRAPRKLTAPDIDLCRVLCDLFSHGLTRLEDRVQQARRRRLDTLARQMRARAQDAALPESTGSFLDAFAPRILAHLGAVGARVRLNDGVHVLGPGHGAAVAALTSRLEERLDAAGGQVVVTNHVAAFEPDLAEALLPACAGAACVRSECCGSALLAWRPASPRLETWGGDPRKQVTENGRLSPRGSFDLWQAETIEKSEPWAGDQAERMAPLLAVLVEVGWTLERRRAEQEARDARQSAERAKSEMEHSALHDALTDLPNRRSLEHVLAGIALDPGAGETRLAALHIDLDRFKAINDTLGHAAGDAVLKHVALTLCTAKRESDFVARIGGDEFVLVARDRIGAAELETLASGIIERLGRPFAIGEEVVQFGASIGIAYAPRRGLDGEALLARADIALYESKRRGRGRLTFVSDEMEQKRIERRHLGEDVKRGFEAKEFELFYQLQFDAATRAVVGAEALLRWHHPGRGLLPAEAFLDAAEEVGVIHRLDALAVEAALAAQARWAEVGLIVPRISVNISARRLKDMDIRAMVEASPKMRSAIAFELLESMDLANVDPVSAWTIDQIREAGIPIEIDDFGTGHTSILSLVRLKPERIKIDKDLVIPIVDSAVARDIIGALVAIAGSLGIRVTAEGVESDAHACILGALGCDTLQGYGLAMPLSLADVVARHVMARAV